MDFIRYRVVDEDGTFLDEFSTNAPDFAKERIPRRGEAAALSDPCGTMPS